MDTVCKIRYMSVPVIDIERLSKYYGKVRGIEEVDLRIEEGEIFGFIGPNGSGKSTTIRILMNLIFPTAGSARIMGLDVVRNTKKIKGFTGYIPSDANAYASMNVREFLCYCMRFYGLRDGMQNMVRLANMFELDLTRRVSGLSLGNKKKVAIIQSLLHGPKLLILDEPTTGLDPLMQSVFLELLQEENRKGMTIFFSSHVLNEVQILCKRVAIIREGRIIRLENIETLRKMHLKKVRIEMGEKLNEESLSIPGTGSMIMHPGNIISFTYSGDMNELIAILGTRKVINLTIEEPTLKEVFMHYYSS